MVDRVSASNWLIKRKTTYSPCARSAIAVTLPGVAISNVVNEVGRDGPCVPGGDTLRVVNQTRGWKLSRKLQSACLGIFLQVATNECPVILRDLPIKLRDRCVQRPGVRG